MNTLVRFFLSRHAPHLAQPDDQTLARLIDAAKRSAPVFRRWIGVIFVVSLVMPFGVALAALAMLGRLDQLWVAAPAVAAASAFFGSLMHAILQAVLLARILGRQMQAEDAA